MNIANEMQKMVVDNLISNLELLIIDGLRRKGFEFDKREDLENFIKTRCRREDYTHKQQHFYYVDEIPFFLHNYEVIYNPIEQNENSTSISANMGTYQYL